ncbi:MAG: 30S ribosomal protein S2 [Verrucomicrobiota bacterium JB022]|nr:30S ribosomal protein S2 [Verrucomicrobiota bacterium JB022]
MNITIRDLLDAGVHFGHQVRRYNPKAKKFVYDNRHGISIIDLEKTYAQLEKATAFVEDLVASGKDILFVGSKKQAQEIVREAANSCGMPYAAARWLGGTLTNFTTVRRSMDKYQKYQKWEADGTFDKMHNKEVAAIRREMVRMTRNFEGIANVREMPGAMFIIDTKNEHIAVEEARRLQIPLVALVDTNSDPTVINYPIPGNDDSIKSIRIVVETIVDAIQAGLARRESPETIQPRNVGNVIAAPATEEQVVPVNPRGASEEVPQSYSSDNE